MKILNIKKNKKLSKQYGLDLKMIIDRHIKSVKLTNELSNFFLIPDIIKFIKELNEKINFKSDEDIIISIKYGKRIVVNNSNLNLNNINPNDFVEIVDYNPLKNMFLTIGPNKPDFNMTIHWIIQNARRDKNVLVQIIRNNLIEINQYNKDKIKETSIEISKDILKKFRESDIIYTDKQEIFLIGNNLKEINLMINKKIEDL